jgi:hypothetical protein
MKNAWVHAWRTMAAVATGCLLAVAVGCSDQVVNNEVSPEGKGTLVLDNLTADTVNVFVGGVQTSIVEAVSESVVYLTPGLYRVVLDQENGARNYRDDVDVLLGRQTILHIDYNLTNANLYSVTMEFN